MLDIDNQYIQETDDARNLLNYLLEQRKFSTVSKKKYDTNCHQMEGITMRFFILWFLCFLSFRCCRSTIYKDLLY